MKKTICCIIDCNRAATMYAAPNVPYCDRHASGNSRSTQDYMSRMTMANLAPAFANKPLDKHT